VNDKGTIMPREQKDEQKTALHTEMGELRKRLAALEARVTELEEEVREMQEAALAD